MSYYDIPARASDAGPDTTTEPLDFEDYCYVAEENIQAARRHRDDNPRWQEDAKRQMITDAIEQLRKALEVL